MGGRRIDDHSFWAGSMGKDSVCPDGAKMKRIDSAEGAGDLSRYEDSEKAIMDMQKKGISQAERHSQPSGERY